MDVRINKFRSLQFYFKLNVTNNKFELYTDNFDELSFTELRDELEEILDFSNITSEHLQDGIIGPRIISTYESLETEKRQTDRYYLLLMGNAGSPFRDFEIYLGMVVGLDEDDIWLIIKKQNNSNFVTSELSLGIHTN